MTGAEGAALCPGLVSSGAASIVSQPSRAQTLESLGRGVSGTPTLTLHGPAFVASASLFGEAGSGGGGVHPSPTHARPAQPLPWAVRRAAVLGGVAVGLTREGCFLRGGMRKGFGAPWPVSPVPQSICS